MKAIRGGDGKDLHCLVDLSRGIVVGIFGSWRETRQYYNQLPSNFNIQIIHLHVKKGVNFIYFVYSKQSASEYRLLNVVTTLEEAESSSFVQEYPIDNLFNMAKKKQHV